MSHPFKGVLMKKHFYVLSLFFAASFVLAGCGGPKGTSSSSAIASESPAISSNSSLPVADGAVLAAAKTIAANATRDGAAVTAQGLLTATGYTGNETLTKTRGFNLLYKAYQASMPAFVGQRNYGAYVISNPYTDVPTEATDAVKFLSDHGILVKETNASGEDIQTFNGDEDFTSGLSRYISRFHAYYGTSLKDDFANTVNHDYLYANPATINKTSADSVEETNLVSQTAINSWVASHADSMADGANKTNVMAYKTSLYYEDAKEANVCAGAYTAYETLTNPTDYSGLFSSCANLFAKQGIDPLFSKFDITGSISLVGHPFGELDVPFTAQYAASDFTSGSTKYNAFVTEANAVFKGVGFSSALADNYASAMGQFNLSAAEIYRQGLAQAKVDTKGYVFSAVEYGPQKFVFQSHLEAAGLGDLKPVDLSSLDSSTAGLPSTRFITDHGIALQAYFGAMSDENFAGAKAQILYNEIKAYLPCNPVAAVTHLGYDSTYLQKSGILEKYFVAQVGNGVIADYKETSSYRNNFDLISKAITDLRAALRKRIQSESWLSSDGKKAALAKVDAIKTSILVNNDNGTGVDVSMPTFTTSLYQNLCLAKRSHWATVLANTDSNFYTERNFEDHFTANACYSPSVNGIMIYMGYLAAHDDFANLDTALLYSRLYLCCGHEITHGFDTNGVNFDENGKSNPSWWSAADHLAYTTRVQSVISFYQGREVLPGQYTNGTTVVSEACADCAGMRLVMDLAKETAGFNYEEFFKDAAQLFMSTCDASLYASFYAPDEHPYGAARCNAIVGAADEFYTTFGIAEGDGMYVAPADRPNVW
jgi:putative endopeptidase